MSQAQRGNKSDPLAKMRTSEGRSDRGQKKRAAPLIETDAKPGRGQPTKPKKVETPLEPFNWRKPSFALAMKHLKVQMRTRNARAMYVAAASQFLLILALGLMVQHNPSKGDGITLASSMSEAVQDVKVETVALPEMQMEQVAVMEAMAAPTTIPSPVMIGQLAGDTYTPDVKVGGEGLSVEGLLTDIGSGDGVGKGVQEKPKPAPKKGAPSMFFGSTTTGERVAFIIDNSMSMKGKMYDVARTELYRTVSTMKPYNKFYVVFYSKTASPMFSPDVEKDMLPPTPENLQKLGQWMLKTEVSEGGTGVVDAFDQCIALKPDVIYLLSDGDYMDYKNRHIAFADKCAAAKIPVNTIGFKSVAGAKVLIEISMRTKGTHIFLQ